MNQVSPFHATRHIRERFSREGPVEEGKEIKQTANDLMMKAGIKKPARYAALICPGLSR